MHDGPDVIVIGSGNAGMCAALAAREAGAEVLLLEKGPPAWVGGNTWFTAGAVRTTFDSLNDLLPLLGDHDFEQLRLTDVRAYTAANFAADLERVTQGRCNGDLVDVLVHEIRPALRWLGRLGLGFRLMYDRQGTRSTAAIASGAA